MKRFIAPLLASAAVCLAFPAHAELDVPALKNAIEASVEGNYDHLDALYKDIHAHPEIAFQEEKTAAKLAAEMRLLQEIFAEVVDKNARIADKARILDPAGKVVKDYSDTGMTAFLEFEIASGSPYFTLEVNGSRIHQGLSDTASVPASEIAK